MIDIRHAALVLALCASAGAVHAQTTIITEEPGARVITRPAAIELTPTQRTVIYRTIVRERTAAVPLPAGVEFRIGARIPEAVTLQTVPDTVAVEVPTIRSYRYMVINNRVWLVDPATSTVVAEVVE
jgi:Protein of unknown function (DUF1236)